MKSTGIGTHCEQLSCSFHRLDQKYTRSPAVYPEKKNTALDYKFKPKGYYFSVIVDISTHFLGLGANEASTVPVHHNLLYSLNNPID